MLPCLPADKANHFIYGALIALAVYALLLPLTDLAAQWALAASVAAAIGKELADRWANAQAQSAGRPPPHGVELLDALATAAGGFFLFVTVQLTHYFGA